MTCAQVIEEMLGLAGARDNARNLRMRENKLQKHLGPRGTTQVAFDPQRNGLSSYTCEEIATFVRAIDEDRDLAFGCEWEEFFLSVAQDDGVGDLNKVDVFVAHDRLKLIKCTAEIVRDADVSDDTAGLPVFEGA